MNIDLVQGLFIFFPGAVKTIEGGNKPDIHTPIRWSGVLCVSDMTVPPNCRLEKRDPHLLYSFTFFSFPLSVKKHNKIISI